SLRGVSTGGVVGGSPAQERSISRDDTLTVEPMATTAGSFEYLQTSIRNAPSRSLIDCVLRGGSGCCGVICTVAIRWHAFHIGDHRTDVGVAKEIQTVVDNRGHRSSG